MEPSFFLSYWRPWDENSSFIDSWGDYIRDTSLVNYGVDRIGDFIQQASRENVRAIEEASQKQAEATIASGMIQAKAIQEAAKMVGFKLDNVSNELKYLNRRMDIALEQQRINQLNLEELLRIPNSEKERLNTIKNGVHYFTAASHNPDLLNDALEEFLKAEAMKKQDYFVLHKIGCIYLFSSRHLAPDKAQDYFLRAGKYAEADIVNNNPIGSNKLKGDFNYTDSSSDMSQIKIIAADSYDKAALSAYVLGDDGNAVQYQERAVLILENGKHLFNYAKYLFRIGDSKSALAKLKKAIDIDPEMLNAVFCDADVFASPKIPEFVKERWAELDNNIEESIICLLGEQHSENQITLLKFELVKEAYKYFKKNNYAKAKAFISFLSANYETLADIVSKRKEATESFLRTFDSPGEARPYRPMLMSVSLTDSKVRTIEDFYRNYNECMMVLSNIKKG